MKHELATLKLALILSVLVISGCVPVFTGPVATPAQGNVNTSEPIVAISPNSGPSGTLVQVAAIGFQPNAPVSIVLGPIDFEFDQVAQGVTDANGVYIVNIPVEGEPGKNFIFAVTVEGQAGDLSQEPFQITHALPSPSPIPSSTITPTPSPYLDMWATFSSPKFAVSLQYPADWQPVPGYISPELGETRFGAINGFFQIGAMDTDSIDQAAAAEAKHKLQPYGSQPTIEVLQIQGQEARLILPSEDQPSGMQNQAAIIIRYPQPVNVIGTPARYFVLYADYTHIRTIAQTLQFTN